MFVLHIIIKETISKTYCLSLNKYKSNDLEILIRNDNTNTKLNLKIIYEGLRFSMKKKSLGEIESIKFLLSKSKGKYVTIISDDDIISHKILYDIKRKVNFKTKLHLFSINKIKI